MKQGVPEGFLPQALIAERAFLHHLVWDPQEKRVRHLTALPCTSTSTGGGEEEVTSVTVDSSSEAEQPCKRQKVAMPSESPATMTDEGQTGSSDDSDVSSVRTVISNSPSTPPSDQASSKPPPPDTTPSEKVSQPEEKKKSGKVSLMRRLFAKQREIYKKRTKEETSVAPNGDGDGGGETLWNGDGAQYFSLAKEITDWSFLGSPPPLNPRFMAW